MLKYLGAKMEDPLSKDGKCKFFNGVQNDLCDRGVKYSQFLPKLPCIQFIPISKNGGTYLSPGEEPVELHPLPNAAAPETCPFYEENTPEEILKEQQDDAAHFALVVKILPMIAAWKVFPKPEKHRSEVVECPICQGKLHLSQSPYNGHAHAVCETENCVRIME